MDVSLSSFDPLAYMQLAFLLHCHAIAASGSMKEQHTASNTRISGGEVSVDAETPWSRWLALCKELQGEYESGVCLDHTPPVTTEEEGLVDTQCYFY